MKRAIWFCDAPEFEAESSKRGGCWRCVLPSSPRLVCAQVKVRSTLCGLAVFDADSDALLEWFPNCHVSGCVASTCSVLQLRTTMLAILHSKWHSCGIPKWQSTKHLRNTTTARHWHRNMGFGAGGRVPAASSDPPCLCLRPQALWVAPGAVPPAPKFMVCAADFLHSCTSPIRHATTDAGIRPSMRECAIDAGMRASTISATASSLQFDALFAWYPRRILGKITIRILIQSYQMAI